MFRSDLLSVNPPFQTRCREGAPAPALAFRDARKVPVQLVPAPGSRLLCVSAEIKACLDLYFAGRGKEEVQVPDMRTHAPSGYFFTMSVISLVMGVCFFVGCLTYWRVAGISARVVSFGMMCLFGGLANSLAFLVLHRMDSAGYDVGIWRWPRDFKLYAEYWRIAPEKGWSRFALIAAVLCFSLAAAFLFSLPTFAGHPLPR